MLIYLTSQSNNLFEIYNLSYNERTTHVERNVTNYFYSIYIYLLYIPLYIPKDCDIPSRISLYSQYKLPLAITDFHNNFFLAKKSICTICISKNYLTNIKFNKF